MKIARFLALCLCLCCERTKHYCVVSGGIYNFYNNNDNNSNINNDKSWSYINDYWSSGSSGNNTFSSPEVFIQRKFSLDQVIEKKNLHVRILK